MINTIINANIKTVKLDINQTFLFYTKYSRKKSDIYDTYTIRVYIHRKTYVEDGGHRNIIIDASFRSSSHGQTDKPHAGNPELIMRGGQFL